MELKHVVQAACRVVATFEEDGRLAVKAFAQAEYAPGCTTTAEVADHEIAELVKARISDAMALALTDAQELLGRRIGAAIHKSTEVAAANGEL